MRVSGRTAIAIAASLEQHLLAHDTPESPALPTVRGLAASLRVSPATVAAAYRLLRARGLAAGDGRRGTRALPRGAAAPPAVSGPVGRGIVDLASGDPDPALLPSLETALRTIDLRQRRYGERDPTSLEAFAALEFEADGIPGASVAVVSGAFDAIERLLREHLRPGDRVALEDPGYPALHDLLAVSGYLAVGVAVDQEGPLPDAVGSALRRGCRAMIVTPRAQNPTGAALTKERALALTRVLRPFPDLLLIENDYASSISGTPARTLHAPAHRHWAVVRSTSKFLDPDLRVAVVGGDALTIGRLRSRHALGPRRVSRLLQDVALALWSNPSAGRWLARASEIYAQRRTALVSALNAHGIAARAASGFNIWIPVPDEAVVAQHLAARNWAVAPGQRFRIRALPGIRVTVATLQPADAVRLAADLADVLRTGPAHLA